MVTAVHVRLAEAQRDPVVKPEHMPEAHRKYLGYNEHEFTTWAAGVGPKTLDVVRHFLSQGREVEQGYKACASLTKLANHYGVTGHPSCEFRVPQFLSSISCSTIFTLPAISYSESPLPASQHLASYKSLIVPVPAD